VALYGELTVAPERLAVVMLSPELVLAESIRGELRVIR
jgi:hypothetical protein